jgi:TetR/AcrR family transcriptional regulator, transcriptional repressor of bet genes
MASIAKREQTLNARRHDLVQGTIRSIAALGYSSSTVQTICEAANVSRGLIGHYFDGKDALLLEAFRHLCDKQDAEMRNAIREAGGDPLDRLLAATVVSFQSAASRENALVWLALCGVAPWTPSMTDLYHTLYRRYRSWIEHMMVRAARDRGLAVNTRHAALTYAQMVDGFWIGWLMDRDAYSLEEATEIVSEWLRTTFSQPKLRGRKPAAAKGSAKTRAAAKPRAAAKTPVAPKTRAATKTISKK